MNATVKIDAARVELLLSELRLPGIKLIWAAFAETADKEGWPATRILAALAEQEMAERSRRRFERHLEEARLPPGKTLDAFDFDAVPMVSKAQVQALANQPFGEWGKIFPDQAMTLAAIDRLAHHATILEMNVDRYRRKEAIDKARGAGRPPTRATIKGSS